MLWAGVCAAAAKQTEQRGWVSRGDVCEPEGAAGHAVACLAALRFALT